MQDENKEKIQQDDNKKSQGYRTLTEPSQDESNQQETEDD